MNRLKLALALVLLSSSALATTFNCTLSPQTTVITNNEALQLQITCTTDAPIATTPTTPVVTTPTTPVTGDPGVGLWRPPGTTNRIVASAPSSTTVSYVPGCLNGQSANNSYTGCAKNTSYSNSQYTVNFGYGNQVLIRYRPKEGAGTRNKYLRVRGPTGTNVDVANVRAWLSADPTVDYNNVPSKCKVTSSSTPTIVTGPESCPLSSSVPVYYLGISYNEAVATRFQVDISSSDLQP